ncbi:hypothetical protein ACFOLD_05315 [Kocuria carniphila]|uniref:hypothetical protein n=1 Tax=Kocuria carniphila TaxID=262208 RepID=UPI00361219B2
MLRSRALRRPGARLPQKPNPFGVAHWNCDLAQGRRARLDPGIVHRAKWPGSEWIRATSLTVAYSALAKTAFLTSAMALVT